jgi:hypothetical protein
MNLRRCEGYAQQGRLPMSKSNARPLRHGPVLVVAWSGWLPRLGLTLNVLRQRRYDRSE